MSIELTSEQAEAAERMIATATAGETFMLDGLAGTGKTTVLGVVAAELEDTAELVAPTGVAAAALAKKTGLPATTIHRAIYHPPTEIIDPKTGKRRLVWERKREPGSLTGTTFLLDEASMVSTALSSEMLSTGANIVAVGDSGQLPPVEGLPFFCRANLTLRTIHRQALESPIIRQAHAVRGGGYRSDGDAFRVVERIDPLAHDIIISLKNATRDRGNAVWRMRAGLTSPFPVEGELVVCLLNAYEFGIYNGAIYKVARDFRAGDATIAIIDDDRALDVPCAFVQSYGGKEWNPRAFLPRIPFAFGYAITCHKSQGSEWDRVAIVDETWPRYPDRSRWLYTALTRASGTVEITRYRGCK
jgi:exodeoxyribonuclease-5